MRKVVITVTTVAPATAIAQIERPDVEIDFPVLGMTCAACVRRVETAAGRVAGVSRVDVNLPLSRVRLAVGATTTVATARAAAAAIRDAGYDVPADVVDALDRPASEGAGAARLAAIERATRDEVAGLMGDLLVSHAPPAASGRLSRWVRQHADQLGRHYASEIARRRPPKQPD